MLDDGHKNPPAPVLPFPEELTREDAAVGAFHRGAAAVFSSSCAGAFARSRNSSRDIGRANLIRCVEEPGRLVDRYSHDRPPNSEIDGPIQVTMRVASGGSVLVHEIAPGGVPEPTMIYLEGDRLTLVHYCEAGNRPRLLARKSPDQSSVEFDFVAISGCRKPTYLSHFGFTVINADHHIEDWTFMLPGDKAMHAHFDLKRSEQGVAPPTAK